MTAEAYWRREARLSAEDGRPEAALAAMAQAIGLEALRRGNPIAWADLDEYRAALGVTERLDMAALLAAKP